MLKLITRYSVNGIALTIIGPSIFWALYPLGAVASLLLSETLCHLLRFLSFRFLVFPREHGYTVSATRYLISIMPATMASLLIVLAFKSIANRTQLVLITALTSLAIGLVSSHMLYKRPAANRTRSNNPASSHASDPDQQAKEIIDIIK